MKIGVLITVGMSTIENWLQGLIENLSSSINKNIRDQIENRVGELSLENYTKAEEFLQTRLLEFQEALKGKENADFYNLWAKMKEDLMDKNENFSAELATFSDFVDRELNKLNDLELHIWFLTTKETKNLAKDILEVKVREIVQGKIPKKPDIKHVEIESGVNSENEFNKTLKKELPERLEKFFIDEKFDRRYLLISGGYKGLIPLISLLGMMYPETYLVYRHDKGTENVIIYPLPITPDFSSLDSVRSLLKSGKLPESSEVEEELSFLKGFFENKELTSLGSFFRKFYENRTVYGRGETLLNKIQDKKLRDALEEQLKYWEYLWIGDQIPETVEHSRKHSLRLLEYASHIALLYPEITGKLGDEGLFILYSAIWLHDFGHSATVFNGSSILLTKCLDNKILNNLKENGNNLVALNPDIIRKYHHIFTVDMLSSNFEFLLPDVEEELINGILLACLYHRKKMPIVEPQRTSNENKMEGKSLVECLRTFYPENSGLREKIKFAASLLSFIDGLDVQTDRVVSKEYEEMRSERDKYEVNFHLMALKHLIRKMQIENTTKSLIGNLENLIEKWEKNEDYQKLKNRFLDVLLDPEAMEKEDTELSKGIKEIQELGKSPLYHIHRILFIISQKKHFEKHKTVEFIYLDKDIDNKLRINVVVNPEAENKDKVFEEVEKEIRDEFKKVKPVLKEFIPDISVDKIEL